MVNYSRHNKKWGINEILALEREYSLLELPINDISIRHKRTPFSILLRLQKENIIDDSTKDGWVFINNKWIKKYETPTQRKNNLLDSFIDTDLTIENNSVNELEVDFDTENENNIYSIVELLKNKLNDFTNRLEIIETKLVNHKSIKSNLNK
jgi:hypothetical protein